MQCSPGTALTEASHSSWVAYVPLTTSMFTPISSAKGLITRFSKFVPVPSLSESTWIVLAISGLGSGVGVTTTSTGDNTVDTTVCTTTLGVACAQADATSASATSREKKESFHFMSHPPLRMKRLNKKSTGQYQYN